MKIQNKTSFYLLRGALIRTGYKDKAHNILLDTVAVLKASKTTRRRVKSSLDLAIRTLQPMFELKAKKVAAQKLKIPAYIEEKRATLMLFAG